MASFPPPARFNPRVLILFEQLTLLRGNTVNRAAPVWAPKDPATTTTRAVDFCQLLYGRRIISAQASASGGGGNIAFVGNSTATVSGSVVSMTFSGGTAGTDAAVLISITCQDGTTETALVDLPILAPAPLATEGPTS